MKNNIIPLCRADVFKTNVGTTQQIQDLISEILEVKENSPHGIIKSNVGCWRYNNPCKDIDWLMHHILNLLDDAVDFYDSHDKIFNSREKNNLVQVDYWANVNDPGSRNAVHSHKQAQFSAVYYLQAADTGILRFINPANIMSECNTGSPFTADVAIDPAEGDLILWPSWMPHEVETNFSNKQRINLAFDLKIKQ